MAVDGPAAFFVEHFQEKWLTNLPYAYNIESVRS